MIFVSKLQKMSIDAYKRSKEIRVRKYDQMMIGEFYASDFARIINKAFVFKLLTLTLSNKYQTKYIK